MLVIFFSYRAYFLKNGKFSLLNQFAKRPNVNNDVDYQLLVQYYGLQTGGSFYNTCSSVLNLCFVGHYLHYVNSFIFGFLNGKGKSFNHHGIP